jgi:HSP20 family molecular chaperone IbpA
MGESNKLHIPHIHSSPGWNRPGYSPTTIKELPTHFEIALVFPDFEKDDFIIKVFKDVLSVSIGKKISSEKAIYYPSTIFFRLDDSVDVPKTNVSYNKPVMKIMLPKRSVKEKNKSLFYFHVQ